MTPADSFLRSMAAAFEIPGDIESVRPFGSGHINRTFVSVVDQAGVTVRYIHQRINEAVFHHPEEVMENIVRVVDHLRSRLAAEGRGDLSRRTLTVIPARDGKPFWQDGEGGYWRTYLFVEKTCTLEVLETPGQAFTLGESVGRFQSLLSDLGGPRLHETIPNFHNARTREEAFEQAVADDVAGRAASVGAEIDYFRSHREGYDEIVRALADGSIPERITHNDTKINNLLMDKETGESICMIDLDTVMPGSALYDFGDLVRTTTISCAEDERDLSGLTLKLPVYESLVRGYARTAAAFLTGKERTLLPAGGRIITRIMGIRFLTDYLSGDVYYHIDRPGHNLDRCRTQIGLLREMDRYWHEIEDLTGQAVR